MYYGFTEFCQSFLHTFPGYYIWPLRLNGSALETIFSQLKFSMNGHLTSVNYAPALATLKLKRQIHGWRGKYVYRRTPLYVRELPLKRHRHWEIQSSTVWPLHLTDCSSSIVWDTMMHSSTPFNFQNISSHMNLWLIIASIIEQGWNP